MGRGAGFWLGLGAEGPLDCALIEEEFGEGYGDKNGGCDIGPSDGVGGNETVGMEGGEGYGSWVAFEEFVFAEELPGASVGGLIAGDGGGAQAVLDDEGGVGGSVAGSDPPGFDAVTTGAGEMGAESDVSGTTGGSDTASAVVKSGIGGGVPGGWSHSHFAGIGVIHNDAGYHAPGGVDGSLGVEGVAGAINNGTIDPGGGAASTVVVQGGVAAEITEKHGHFCHGHSFAPQGLASIDGHEIDDPFIATDAEGGAGLAGIGLDSTGGIKTFCSCGDVELGIGEEVGSASDCVEYTVPSGVVAGGGGAAAIIEAVDSEVEGVGAGSVMGKAEGGSWRAGSNVLGEGLAMGANVGNTAGTTEVSAIDGGDNSGIIGGHGAEGLVCGGGGDHHLQIGLTTGEVHLDESDLPEGIGGGGASVANPGCEGLPGLHGNLREERRGQAREAGEGESEAQEEGSWKMDVGEVHGGSSVSRIWSRG